MRGNVLQVIEKNRLGGSSAESTLTTYYGYNALKELLSVTDAKGNATRATYDTLGRIVTLTSPDAGRTDFQFDLSGNLAAKQTANLVQACQYIRYQYDYNRLKKIDYPNSPDVSYEYGSPTEAGPIGLFRASRIKTETSEAGTKAYEYDPLGNVNEETWTLRRIGSESDTTTRTFGYDYDSFGRLLAVYYPGASAEVVHYGYDAGGNLDMVTGSTKNGTTTQYVQHIGYDEYEQRTLLTVGNGITTKFSYDQLTRRLSAINASERDPALVKAGAPPRPFQQVAYQYDLVGNVTQIANTAPFDATMTGTVKVGPVTENFTYDDLYQLRTADGLHQTSATNRYHYGLSFGYDPISNILQKAQVSETQTLSGSTVTQTATRTDQTYTSDFAYAGGRPHAPSEVADTLPGTSTATKRAFTYDKDGNQAQWQQTTGTATKRNSTYTDDNRLSSVKQDSAVLQEALYDAAGQRLVKRANGSAQTAYFGQYLTVRDAVPTTKHIYAGDLRVASKFVPNDANEECATCTDRASVTYFHGDQLGSTTFATDETQTLVAHEQYFPSGELWVDQTSDTAHTRQPYLFNGKELDVETGLYYYGARYYDPRIGVWTSPDPVLSEYMQGAINRGVHLPQNLALYSYSWNNPVTIRDPNGKCPMCITAAVGAAIGGAIGGGVYLARAAITGGDVTARGLLGATAGGVVAGAMAGLTGGTSLVAQAGVAGAIGVGATSGVAGGLVSRGIETGDASKTFDPKAIAVDAALGGAFAGAAYGVGKGISAIRSGSRAASETTAPAAEAAPPAQTPSGFCFTAGTLVQTAEGLVPIETIQVGDRVETLGDADASSTEVDASTWRLLRLRMPNPDGSNDVLELKVLRPMAWVADSGSVEGGWIAFGLPEMGLYGPAYVDAIGAIPPIRGGHGRVVLSTVTHLNGEVMVLRLAGADGETLEPTARHSLYSTTRERWVPAGELRQGEWLLGRSGPVQIAEIGPRAGVHRVFNIEVETKHAYAVTALGVLSHNEGGCARAGAAPEARFISQPDGTLVDTYATPPGSYDQPGVQVANGTARARTDILLQGGDHGAGLSHTHDPILRTTPDGRTFHGGHQQPGRPVSFEDAQNIQNGAAMRSQPKGR